MNIKKDKPVGPQIGETWETVDGLEVVLTRHMGKGFSGVMKGGRTMLVYEGQLIKLISRDMPVWVGL